MKKAVEKTEVAKILARGLLGAIPIAGPLMAEIVGSIIPNQREERLIELAESLSKRLDHLQEDQISKIIKTPESIDLLEDGFIQATRALTKNRTDYIAALLKNGLTNEELEYIEYKRLLSLLGELTDAEVIILISYSYDRFFGEENPETTKFFDKHKGLLEEPTLFMGASQLEQDSHTLYHSHRTHLVNLGLLKHRYKKTNRGEMPEFDEKTGSMKITGYEMTGLGRLLLKNTDSFIPVSS